MVVVHCSGSPSGKRLGGGLGNRRISASQVIDGWHANRGFQRRMADRLAYNSGLGSIGYHYVIDLDGMILSGRGIAEVGAHAAGYNARSIGICLVGGMEPKARYTSAQWESLRRLVDTLRTQRPGLQVVGHRDLSPDADGDGEITRRDWLKTCPGFSVADWLRARFVPPADQVLGAQDLANHLAAPNTPAAP